LKEPTGNIHGAGRRRLVFRFSGSENMLLKTPLPPEYKGRSDVELRERITRAKEALGERVVLLGHHYQQRRSDRPR
jgi:hypothetical protein